MKTLVFVLASALLVVACNNSKMRNMSDGELAAKNDECLRAEPTAPGKVTACENIRKECERRRGEGVYAC